MRTVPVHVSCNAAYADDNDYFRTILVADDGSERHPIARKIIDGPLRRIMLEREAQWMRYSNGGFRKKSRYTNAGIYLGEQLGFALDLKRIQRVLNNIVKGLYYTLTNEPLAPTTRIEAEILQFANEPINGFEDKLSEWCDFGDDVFRFRYALREGGDDMICHLSFYRNKFYVAYTKSGLS